MREGPSGEVLAGAAGWGPTAASWLDGDLLAGDIPVLAGSLSATTELQVPERLTFTVPEASTVDGRWFSWVPGDNPRHPLARFGQQIDVGVTVRSSLTGEETLTRLGRYRVHEWQHDDLAGTVHVTCFGLLIRAEEARFRVPQVPRAGGSLASEFRRLMVPGLPVSIDPTLVDRPCPRSFQWPQDRLKALYEIADAWPARIRTDQWGQVRVLPPLPDVPDPVLTLTDGQGGTVVSAPRGDTREGLSNVVVGTSSAIDGTAQDPIRAVAEHVTGPAAVTTDGTGYGEVVRYWSSPLATSATHLQASVNTILANAARPAVVRTVQCAPDPRIDLDDAVAIKRGYERDWGWVVAYMLPLTYDGGPMRLDVGVSR